ncbi:uncharacterized protein I206_104737 [Kwoniella pini CBS 10737]|uniref:Uncharacterized protein n=1 Tax=Kwoniella pini CBS 10737 TaxID=1296096 RepID=A0A1B9I7Q6_9TREE|nr:uncharacterized protein I206_02275 [Kwoniella pini CBS 10737]OCF51560.1 hypothetical protein I206_02275 [Kwoniella pini CBS 10737]
MSEQRVEVQPPASNGMRLVRQSTDDRTPDDVSIFSFSEDTKAGWCGCFGSSNKEEKPPPRPSPREKQNMQHIQNISQSQYRTVEKPSPTYHNTSQSPPTNQQRYANSAFQPYAGTTSHNPQQQRTDTY